MGPVFLRFIFGFRFFDTFIYIIVIYVIYPLK